MGDGGSGSPASDHVMAGNVGGGAFGNKMPRRGVRRFPERSFRYYGPHDSCLAKSILLEVTGLCIAEHMERNKGIEREGLGCACVIMERFKVTVYEVISLPLQMRW